MCKKEEQQGKKNRNLLVISSLSLIIFWLINSIIMNSDWFEIIILSPEKTRLLALLLFYEILGILVLVVLTSFLHKFRIYLWVLAAISILLIGIWLGPILDSSMFDRIWPFFLCK